MSPVAAVRSCLRKYVGFRGRASRSEHWWFLAFTLVTLPVAVAVERALGIAPLGRVLWLALTALPGLAAMVRRLHDTGRSGLWCFITLIPFFGGIWLLVLLCLPSEGDNHHGPSPENVLRYGAPAR